MRINSLLQFCLQMSRKKHFTWNKEKCETFLVIDQPRRNKNYHRQKIQTDRSTNRHVTDTDRWIYAEDRQIDRHRDARTNDE